MLKMKVIDLTSMIEEDMFVYPKYGQPIINRKEARTEEETQGGYSEGDINPLIEVTSTKYFSGDTSFEIRNHHGTHVDAPAHKIPGGKTIDQYSPEKFINKSDLIDLTSTDLLKRPKREIKLEDIENKMPSNNEVSALIFYTGFCDEMKNYQENFKEDGKLKFEKTFPYFSQKSARYIVDRFKYLDIIGIDSFAVDPSGSNSEVHRIFFEKDILPLETLFNLAELKSSVSPVNRIFGLYCAPLKYLKSDAAQTRAFAMVN